MLVEIQLELNDKDISALYNEAIASGFFDQDDCLNLEDNNDVEELLCSFIYEELFLLRDKYE